MTALKKETLGERVRRLRSRRDLSASFVAKTLGVAESTYREWENGRAIRGEPYIALSQILKVGVWELLTGEKMNLDCMLNELANIEGLVKNIRTELLKRS